MVSFAVLSGSSSSHCGCGRVGEVGSSFCVSVVVTSECVELVSVLVVLVEVFVFVIIGEFAFIVVEFEFKFEFESW
jgi:hypothetical protein